MLTIQQTKLLTREAGGIRIPRMKRGKQSDWGGGVKMTGGIVERAGVKGTDDGCTSGA